MNSRIERGGKLIRPSFNYRENESFPDSQISAEMLESIRNLLESCQMLQCDVASAIKQTRYNTEAMLREIRGLRRDLKRKRRKAR